MSPIWSEYTDTFLGFMCTQGNTACVKSRQGPDYQHLRTRLIEARQASGLTQSQVAEQLGIDIWRAEVSPSEKAGAIESLAQAGKRVLMVGDGLNDTVALAAAHVSISPASAADAARSASDIVLLGTSLAPIAEACRISRKATARIRENFQLATLYNVIAVPLAIAGMATPLVAALAMSTSSLTVSVNALRLGPRR